MLPPSHYPVAHQPPHELAQVLGRWPDGILEVGRGCFWAGESGTRANWAQDGAGSAGGFLHHILSSLLDQAAIHRLLRLPLAK